ncbi:hypothetical protein ES703_36982 [subsurface metagenome]
MNKLIFRYKRVQTYFKRYGFLGALFYVLKNGPYKRAKNFGAYVLIGRKYPQNIIFITALPKSGSTWLRNLFSCLPGFDPFSPYRWNTSVPLNWDERRWDLYPEIFDEFTRKLAVIRGHTWGKADNIDLLKETGLKYFINVRDPRDKLISEYWHNRNFPIHWERELAFSKSLAEYITYKLDSGEFERQTIDWLRSWLDGRDETKSLLLRYEDTLTNTRAVVREALHFLGFDYSEKEIDRVVVANTFEKASGRKRGAEDQKHFLRKGVRGEWKEVFSEEHKTKFKHIGEDVIKALAYEPTSV